jgi:murein peptide amidase A
MNSEAQTHGTRPASRPQNVPSQSPASTSRYTSGRSLDRLLQPLDLLSERSRHIVGRSSGKYDTNGRGICLPRYLFVGPKGGGDVLRLGIFATLHGDEPEGALALIRFLELLERTPDIAQGYALFIYPVANPSGYIDNTRHARGGIDLNRQFWKESREPEVRFLESEIWMQGFHGLISLHTDDTSDGVYGYVKGHVLSEHLLEPALIEAGRHLPRNRRETIDGFPARAGIIHEGYPGMLQSTPGLHHPPFEITLETPQLAPVHRQVDAFVAALQTILVEFRYLQAIAPNI